MCVECVHCVKRIYSKFVKGVRAVLEDRRPAAVLFTQALTAEDLLVKLNAGGFSVRGKCQFLLFFTFYSTFTFRECVVSGQK